MVGDIRRRDRRMVLSSHRGLGRLARKIMRHWMWIGWGAGAVTAAAIAGVFIHQSYADAYAKAHLTPATASLAGALEGSYAQKLNYDAKTQTYEYNKGYIKPDTTTGQSNAPKFTAAVSAVSSKPVVKVTDPVSQLSVSFEPKFEVLKPLQDANRLIFPLKDFHGSQVITLNGGNLKEDIILNKYEGENLSFSYRLDLPNELEARMQNDGSLGIFGPDPILLGDVSTGSEADAQLLARAKEKGAKSSLIFSFPAPYVKDARGISKTATARYELDGTTLTVIASNMKSAQYPLTIDPSVYVTSASDFMRGNNESNIDFDTTNSLIQKGTLTGARINAWTKIPNAQDLPAGLWNHATVVTGGFIYVIGGSTGSTNQSTVYFAKLDPTTYAITSPNPGAGTCTQWCTNSAYNLLGARGGLTAVAYSGYLYAIGGFDGAGARQTSVYVARIGANGEPISWSSTTALTTERSYASAVAYQNKVYVLGGQSDLSTGGMTGAGSSVYANINPNGTIGAWSNTTTNMPNALWGHTAMEYNGVFYLAGGVNGTTTQNAVQYTKASTTGDLNQSWTNTTAFNTPRGTLGGTIASIWGGYMYISGGCTTMTATNCTQFYNTGTASQSGTTITGSGTTWTSAMVGMDLVFANGISATITAFTSATSLVAIYDSQTVASQAYTIDLHDLSPQVASINADGTLSAWRTITLNGGEYYMTGTASQSGDDITGTGVTWNIDMIGQTIRYANGVSDVIEGFENSNTLRATTSRTVTGQAYTISTGIFYGTGTASQSGTTITGSGTAWTSDMVGMTITFANGGANTPAIITSVASATSMTASGFSQSVASSVYVIRNTHPRLFSTGFVAWRNTLYTVGGCSAMSGGNCSTVTPENQYGHINNDGDVSQKRAEPTMPAAGTAAGTVGRMTQGVVINNGYIYTIGGCGNNGCTSGNMNSNLAYAAIGSDGSITTNGIASCNGGGAATWCVVGVALNGTGGTAGLGLGAFGVTVYNNTIYTAGGTPGNSTSLSRFFYLQLNADGSPNGTFTDNGTVGTNVVLPSGGYGYPFVFSRVANATTGNIYIIGGCVQTAGGVGCSGAYIDDIVKCEITNATRAVNNCSIASQLQLATATALAAGAVYGNFIYFCGGANASAAQTDTCYYARLNASNNVVRADNGNATGGWQTATARLPQIRRRTAGFTNNGYMYVVGGHDGAVDTTLHDVLFAKIDLSTGDLRGTVSAALFDTSTTTITGRWNLGLAAANGFVYVVGGCTSGPPPTACSGMSGIVEDVQVHNNASGSPQSYVTASNNVGTDYIAGKSVVSNGYIYYAGGCTNIGCTTFTNAVSYAPINVDGNIGAWAATTAMGSNRAWFGLAASGGYMYAVGGQNAATAIATTEHAFICDGTATGGCVAGAGNIGKIGTWSADTSMGVGNERADFGFAVFNGYMYVAGGSNNSGTLQTTVFHSLIGAGSLGAWTTTDTAFTTARSGAALVAYGASLYLLGGYDGTNYLFDSQYVNIYTNAADGTIGTIGTWVRGTSLPQPVRQGSAFAANGYLYLFGGRSAASTCTTNTYVAAITGYLTNDPITGLASPTLRVQRYGIGAWSQTVVAYSDARYGAAAVYGTGKTYILGGGCTALVGTGTGTTANRAFYSSLQAQPQLASYSISIDTDTDVFPAKWLMNGLDNGTGAQWVLNYRSSTLANAVWGLNTNAGTITLGTPGTYTPLDGAGVDTNATVGARWYYLAVAVDASNAFGYPEDVTRGPTIADITLQFSTDPSKRLHHGKTFTSGQLQPLDAPF